MLLLAFIVSLGALIVIYFSKGLVALDTFDFWVGNYLVFTFGMIEFILFGGLRRPRAREDMLKGRPNSVRHLWFLVKYVSPVYLLAIFLLFCRYKMKDYIVAIMQDKVVEYVLAFIVSVAVFFGMLIWQAGKRWDERRPLRAEEDVIP